MSRSQYKLRTKVCGRFFLAGDVQLDLRFSGMAIKTFVFVRDDNIRFYLFGRADGQARTDRVEEETTGKRREKH